MLASLAPAGATALLAYLRLEVRRSLRNRRYLVFTIAFPVALYVLYTAVIPAAPGASIDGLAWPVFFLASMAAYGAIGAAMSQAAPIAMERRGGWARQLRVTPLPGPAYVPTKVAAAVAVTVPALVLVAGAGLLVNHVDLPAARGRSWSRSWRSQPPVRGARRPHRLPPGRRERAGRHGPRLLHPRDPRRPLRAAGGLPAGTRYDWARAPVVAPREPRAVRGRGPAARRGRRPGPRGLRGGLGRPRRLALPLR